MPNIEHILLFVEAHTTISYVFLFITMLLEGEVFIIIAGIFTHLEALNTWIIFSVALAGVLSGNVLWYVAGKALGKRAFMKPFVAHAEQLVYQHIPSFKTHPSASIFTSKFLYGLNRITVFLAGSFNVPFRVFLKAESLASVLWVILYLALGHFVGYAALEITHRVNSLVLLLIGFVVGFIVFRNPMRYLYHAYKGRKDEKENHNT